MRSKQINKLYEEHKKIIYKKARSFHKTTGHGLEDLVSEGNVLFMRAIQTYDKRKKIKFSTWLWKILTNGLITYTTKTDIPNQDPELELLDCREQWNPSACLIFKEKIENLSEEAKEVVGILLSCPGELLELSGIEAPKIVRGKLKRYLKEESNWTWEKIYNSFREIREVLIVQSI